ncbi:TPA: peroxide stress protein YaaA, partial [Legionella pneumophila]|nr:peroxide stress protein YaaA [Legionella pneumophila]
MLTLLSPAKKLLSISKHYSKETSNPLLLDKALQLVKIMKLKSVEQIADLMDLSRQLAELNYERYQNFDLKNNPMNYSYPALFLFQGDVYQGLNANSWKDEEIEYAQSHLGILSGLYGFLRPLDRIQPYRLEMGVNLENPAGKNLYAFWSKIVTNILNQILAEQSNPVLINLASTEYFKVVDEKKLSYPIVTINFYEQKNSELKMIGILAKKARGMMA